MEGIFRVHKRASLTFTSIPDGLLPRQTYHFMYRDARAVGFQRARDLSKFCSDPLEKAQKHMYFLSIFVFFSQREPIRPVLSASLYGRSRAYTAGPRAYTANRTGCMGSRLSEFAPRAYTADGPADVYGASPQLLKTRYTNGFRQILDFREPIRPMWLYRLSQDWLYRLFREELGWETARKGERSAS